MWFWLKNSIMQIRKFSSKLYQKLLSNSLELKFVLSKGIDNSVTFISREKNNLFSYLWSCHIRNGTMGLDCFELVQTPIQLFQSFDRHPNVVIIWKEEKKISNPIVIEPLSHKVPISKHLLKGIQDVSGVTMKISCKK